jgi:hypothetical protein
LKRKRSLLLKLDRVAPYIPPIDPSNASDTQNFDDAFLDMEPVIDNEPDHTDSEKGGERTDTDRTDGEDSVRTPAQSRSPSTHPQEEEDGPDLFDGYSFKGRHSVLIDDDDEGGVESEERTDDEIDRVDDDAATQASAEVSSSAVEDEEATPEPEVAEPKTPEPRKTALPEETVVVEPTPTEPVVTKAAEDEAEEIVEKVVPEMPPTVVEVPPTPKPEPVTEKEADILTVPRTPERKTVEIAPVPTEIPQPPVVSKLAPPARIPPRNRREKSGIPALDKYLSDGGDDGDNTERDEDDDWDFIEAPGAGFEDRNGPKGTSLFARGVVDRYRLAVFRKASTPGKNNTPRNVSGMSTSSDANDVGVAGTPSPSEKQRRGRNPPLSFRRNPKTFLRARSPAPPSSYSSRTNGTSKTLTHSMSASSASMITPSASMNSSTVGPSLKSKESTTSVGSPSSDDQSLNGDAINGLQAPIDVAANGHTTPEASKRPSRVSLVDEKTKTKKLKKYKEGAEKMLSLFASPRQ